VTAVADVVVVGAGAFGAWCAWHAQSAGRRTLLLDPFGPGNSRSSSGGETRIIRMGYGAAEVYTRFAQRSLASWRDLFARTGQDLFHPTGVLSLGTLTDPLGPATRDTLARLGVIHEVLGADELRRRHPALGVGDEERGIFEPGSGVLMARRAVELVAQDAQRAGVRLHHAAVRSVGCGSGPRLDAVLTLAGERFAADLFVFACGPWLPKVLPDVLGDRIFPTRQEVFFFGAPPADPRFVAPQLPAWIDFAGEEAYGLPDLDGRGVKVALDRHGPPFDPDHGERLASAEGVARARAVIAHRLKALASAPLLESRVCQYENTANGDLIADRHPAYDNVWIVGGGSGHGFKHAPAIAEYAWNRIAGDGPTEPRFSLGDKGTLKSRAVF
jgi:glycine/D-amino acid oxidase-like deaminating enzyme